jgi:hypothetical protein|tara:strand:+ start:10359 stop:11117 length:759 start_codon:yes stop_codon:yes gene_type:complete
MDALLNLPSHGGGFTRVGVGEGGVGDGVTVQSPSGTSPDSALDLDSNLLFEDLPNVRYDCAGQLVEYICDHNATPPAHQYITTDKTNVLIRALTVKKSKDTLAGRGSNTTTSGHHNKVSSSSDPTQKPKSIPPGFGAKDTTRARPDLTHVRPSSTGLERLSKNPKLEGVVGTLGTKDSTPDSTLETGSTNLDSLSIDELKNLLKARGVGGLVLNVANKKQLLAQVKTLANRSSGSGGGASGSLAPGGGGIGR